MTTIYGLIFIAGLLTGSVGGWLITAGHYERIKAAHDLDELEITEFQELYAAWAMLHDIKQRSLRGESSARHERTGD
jgi:hypothetical protein